MLTLRTGLLEELLTNTLSGNITWMSTTPGELFNAHYKDYHVIFNRVNEPDIGMDEIHIRVNCKDKDPELIIASRNSLFWNALYTLRKAVINQISRGIYVKNKR